MPLLQGIYGDTPLNTTEILQAELNVEEKSRSNLFPWNGQFTPQLIQLLLETYRAADSIALDPFLGSGTVLLESGRMGLPAFGTEINPAAFTLARTYQFINVPIEDRRTAISNLDLHLRAELPDPLPLFRSSEALKMKLIGLASGLDELRRFLTETLIVMLDFDKPTLSLSRVFEEWERLSTIVLGLPFSESPIQALHNDARNIPLNPSSVSLVVTSPPYINVFNYHQRYRASMEALRWRLLVVARSEFGSNRKHRGNRFLTVIQFCLDMAQALNDILRVCKSDARLIFVLGRESMVRGTAFFNGEIVAQVAHKALGLNLLLRQERVFLNRYGQRIYEDILHFSLPAQLAHGALLEEARLVAQQVLEAAYQNAPHDSKKDLLSALSNIDGVMPSPLFQRVQAYNAAVPDSVKAATAGAKDV